MRSLIAALRNLVLPSGATSGRRIIISGDNGDIEIYDSSGTLRLRIGLEDIVFAGSMPIEFFSKVTSEQNPGLIFSRAIGAGVTRQAQQILQTPILNASRSTVDMRTTSFDGTIKGVIDLAAEGDATFTNAVGTSSIAKRCPTAPALITGNVTGITAEADVTGLSVTWNAVQGRRYKLSVAARGVLLTTTTIAGRCRVSITDSVNNHVGGDCDILIPVGAANVVLGPVYDVAYITPLGSGSVTYKVRGAKIAGDAGATMTFAGAPGAGSGGATLAVEDMGIV